MLTQLTCFLLTLLTGSLVAQEYGPVDDIPIESYDLSERQEEDIDLELLPRRKLRPFSNEDPKEYFFGSMRAYEDKNYERNFGLDENIPKPNGLGVLHGDYTREKRKKRNTEDKSLNGIVKTLGKPLELTNLNPHNVTAKVESLSKENLLINDFIRFRRAALVDVKKEMHTTKSNLSKLAPVSEKLVMQPFDEINREARGATKEHWVKQVYPIRKNDELQLDDNIPSSSENIRAPRVHFVTQRLADNGLAPSEIRSYQREARSRNLDREPPLRDLPRGMDFYRDRYRAPYVPMGRAYYREEMYRHNLRDPRDIYRPRYENYDRPSRTFYPSPANQKSQKRIVYYATLPEISRNPPNEDRRDRYRYDRYDERYLVDPYRSRKSYPKSRYEDESKNPYPVKVSTDVNVSEVKKNPERRIYSEVDRNRYAFNTPSYQRTDG